MGFHTADAEPGGDSAIWGYLYQGAETMTRRCSLVIEGVSMGYSAYVPELPTILVTGRSVEELTARAAEAIRLYREACLVLKR